ncbi:uncharacterized protein LOC115216224 [Octopus sinensis]|uniref:Uncharacterized protein LOC115216224 n=1 Tax=Octopus sinensis TaxID=2607531 RepID=A0A6P7SSM6_9MOLL|nr:uncharacterized protein LOC115216224 [Octopus sinensis]
MDKDHYRYMFREQLNGQHFHKKLNQNEDKKAMSEKHGLVLKYRNNLTGNEVNYLTNFEVKTSNFYGLPKIHKSKERQNKRKQFNQRPEITRNHCRTSILIHIVLKPLCNITPRFVRDDMDFLNYIPKSVHQETILVSFDVTSLYTNILHDPGIEAINFCTRIISWKDSQTLSF